MIKTHSLPLSNLIVVQLAAISSNFFIKRVTMESVDKAHRLVHQRAPSPEERSELLSYASKHGLAAACRLLFNSNEFLFLK